MLMAERGDPQLEGFRSIHLSREQSFLRFVETERVAQFTLAQLMSVSSIEQQPIAFPNRFHLERNIVLGSDRISNAKADAPQRGVIQSVLALLGTGTESHDDGSAGDTKHAAQP